MTRSPGRPVRRIALLVLLASVAVACSAGAGPSRIVVGTPPGSSGGAGGASGTPEPSPVGATIPDPALREALLVRFGDLVWCDPDVYPIARADETTAARDHLAAMRADAAAWTVIAGRVGFDPGTTPGGAALVAAYRNWKMLRGLALTPTSDGQRFDAVFEPAGGAAGGGPASGGGGAPNSGGLVHVVGAIRPDGSIVVDSSGPGTRPNCPICLARGTRIATPAGDRAVETLRAGDLVWTAAPAGDPVAAPIVEVGSTSVPPTHEVVHLVLADGRTVDVSPGHPLPDGRPVGSLAAGDRLDGSTVVSAERVPYGGGRTFDLLPGGPTGAYWANGISLGSTLR